MKKTMLTTLVLTLSALLYAAPDLLLREALLPGANVPAPQKALEKITLTPDYAAAGTCAFWVRPDGWDQSDKAWHFFLTAGKQSRETAYINIFRQAADGKIRMVWSKASGNNEVTDIFTTVPFRSGEWHHFALTWQDDSKGCVVRLYVDGKIISSRRVAFQMKESFPTNWNIGDVPTYRPYSQFKSTIGRIEFDKRALSADEIAALAAQKFVDGKMSFVSRKFVPGSVNKIFGECAGQAEKLEAVFVDEAGKEQKQALPFV